jgi:peptidoglycan/LPS O-acetylase OafA/YrhL
MILAFEGVRGVGALLVALFHLGNLNHYMVVRHFYLLVDLFFVLSGWVITSSYGLKINSLSGLWSYMLRRARRLLPLLYATTLIFIIVQNGSSLVKWIVIDLNLPIKVNHPEALSMVIPKLSEIMGVLTVSHGLGFFDRLILNTPSWSISVELYTYLLFGICCLLFKDNIRNLVIAILCLSGAIATVAGSIYMHNTLVIGKALDLTYDFGITRCIWSFSLGSLIYSYRQSIRLTKGMAQVLSLVMICLLFGWVDKIHYAAFASPFIFALFVFSISTGEGTIAKIMGNDLLRVLGERSFSIYLLHVPLIWVFSPIIRTLALPNMIYVFFADLVFLVTLVFISDLSFRYIEMPFRAKGKAHAVHRDYETSA